ncbi:MAG: tryptophan--tRNA ligase [Rickettsiales bacterium]|nr:tryptophan--tRNA ligase [Rickettsiales bacterium]|tara:strand:- start:1118 stop:2116 length:999 start_codon:yes stop_codon:yes gene_type:complete
MDRIFSGIQPTGNLHLGNYLGAIRNWVRLQDSYECIYCVVDLHAITMWQNPLELRTSTREVTAAFIASGIDPKKNIIFNQSRNSDHAQLAWVFNCVARLGWLNRMTQFKEKAGKHRENASIGLYDYPVLMAADILAYKATHVPVGADQRQHLELARDIGQKFNNDFGVELFPMPEPIIFGVASRVMSLRNGLQKMSKSDPSDYSRINLKDGREDIALKIRKAKTDSEPLPSEVKGLEGRPEAENLVGIYAALADLQLEDVLAEVGGLPFSQFKQKLTELAVEELGPIGSEMQRLLAQPDEIDKVIRDGGVRAQTLTAPVLAEVFEVMGLVKD